MSIVGSTFLYRYSNGLAFQTSFLSNGDLRWSCLEGPEKGRSEQGPVEIREVAPGICLAHWMEKDGMAVTQVLNLDAGTVTSALVFPKGLDGEGNPAGLVIEGTIERVG